MGERVLGARSPVACFAVFVAGTINLHASLRGRKGDNVDEKQQEASQALAQESQGAYMDFLSSMFSMPPAMTTSASPRAISCAAETMA